MLNSNFLTRATVSLNQAKGQTPLGLHEMCLHATLLVNLSHVPLLPSADEQTEKPLQDELTQG